MKLIKKGISFLLVISLVFGLFSAGLSVSAYNTGDDYPQWLKDMPLDYYNPDPWNYLSRECTSFVAHCLNTRNGVAFHNWYGGVNFGDAGSWGDAARSIGITVDMNPTVGSVAWWSYGHVAWVESVSGDTVHTEKYNWKVNGTNDGSFHERDINRYSVSGYIHIKDITVNNTAPTWAKITPTPDKRAYAVNENITFYFSSDTGTSYGIGIDKDGVRIETTPMGSVTSYPKTFSEPGNYSAYI